MKRILIAVMALTVAVSMSACNNQSVDISNASASDIASTIKESVSFVDDMLEVSDEVVNDFYSLPDGVTEMKVYMSSSGATAEELAIFKCDNTETAEAVIKACEMRVEALKEKFEDYIPGEIDKIENAIIQKRDCFIMFACVNDTAPAEASFENYK